MEFRPCIDIHNGKVKQIVGASLSDLGDKANENFVSSQNADYYAGLYREEGIIGGHVILLNGKESVYYEDTKEQALKALKAYPNGLQIGGGINADNAYGFLEAGASHVIVTSYVFQNGTIRYDRLEELTREIGREHLVLDVSCKKALDGYYVVTDRWQKMTNEKVDLKLLQDLAGYCDEFLVHAVDVEGKSAGIDAELVNLLADYDGIPVTYAGGVHEYEDILLLKSLGNGRVNVTVGSALDLFGGKLSWRRVQKLCKEESEGSCT